MPEASTEPVVVPDAEAGTDAAPPTDAPPGGACPQEPLAAQVLAWSPDGGRLAVGYARSLAVDVWDALGGTLARSLPHQGNTRALAYSRDGATLLAIVDNVTAGEGHLGFWDARGGTLRQGPTFASDTVQDPVLSPDGTRFLVPGFHGEFQVFDAATGVERWAHAVSPEQGAAEQGVLLVPRPRRDELVLTRSVGAVELFGLGRDGPPRTLRPAGCAGNDPPQVVFSPDGERLALETGDLGVELRTGPTLARRRVLQRAVPDRDGSCDRHASLAFSPDGARLATLDARGALALWNGVSGAQLQQLSQGSPAAAPEDSAPASVQWSTDGTLLAARRSDGSVELWDVTVGGVPNRRWYRPPEPSRGQPLNSVGMLHGTREALLAVWNAQELVLLDVRTMADRGRLPLRGVVSAAAWSPDGSVLALAGGALTLVRARDGGWVSVEVFERGGVRWPLVTTSQGTWSGDLTLRPCVRPTPGANLPRLLPEFLAGR